MFLWKQGRALCLACWWYFALDTQAFRKAWELGTLPYNKRMIHKPAGPARDTTATITLLHITHSIAQRKMFQLAVRKISRYKKKLHTALLHSVSAQINELSARSTLPAPPLTPLWRYKHFRVLLRSDLNAFIQAKWKFYSWQIHVLHWGEKRFKFSIGRQNGSSGLESLELHLIWRTSFRFQYLVGIEEMPLTIQFCSTELQATETFGCTLLESVT